METFKTLSITAVVFLFTLPSLAAESTSDAPREKTPLERRLIIPDIVGLQFRSSTLGLTPGLAGLIAYSHGDASGVGGAARADTVSVGPSVDVRAGRFTIGGSLRFTHSSSAELSEFNDVQTTSYWLSVVPRVGILVPVSSHITFWPRAGAGFILTSGQTVSVFAKSPQIISGGMIAQLDALVVVDLGSRFFVAGGPDLHFTWTTSRDPGFEQNHARLDAGASVAMGVAF